MSGEIDLSKGSFAYELSESVIADMAQLLRGELIQQFGIRVRKLFIVVSNAISLYHFFELLLTFDLCSGSLLEYVGMCGVSIEDHPVLDVRLTDRVGP